MITWDLNYIVRLILFVCRACNYKVIVLTFKAGCASIIKRLQSFSGFTDFLVTLLYVIRGEVLFRLNDEEHHLREGDLIHYRSEALHSWFNPGKCKSEVLVVNTPPSW